MSCLLTNLQYIHLCVQLNVAAIYYRTTLHQGTNCSVVEEVVIVYIQPCCHKHEPVVSGSCFVCHIIVKCSPYLQHMARQHCRPEQKNSFCVKLSR